MIFPTFSDLFFTIEEIFQILSIFSSIFSLDIFQLRRPTNICFGTTSECSRVTKSARSRPAEGGMYSYVPRDKNGTPVAAAPIFLP